MHILIDSYKEVNAREEAWGITRVGVKRTLTRRMRRPRTATRSASSRDDLHIHLATRRPLFALLPIFTCPCLNRCSTSSRSSSSSLLQERSRPLREAARRRASGGRTSVLLRQETRLSWVRIVVPASFRSAGVVLQRQRSSCVLELYARKSPSLHVSCHALAQPSILADTTQTRS